MSVKHLSALIILCLFVNLTAQADSGGVKPPQFVGVGITDSSGSSIGLRFMPPAEDGWRREGGGVSVTLRKDAALKDDNRQIEAYLMKLDTRVSPISGYVETIRRNLVEGYANSKQFKVSQLEVSEDPRNSRCVRAHVLLEDVLREAGQERKWSEQYALSCGLPRHEGLGIELRYYHRYSDSNKDEHFAEDARKVLESVIIEDK